MKHCIAVFRREFTSYFTQPTAYAIIAIFLALALGLSFTFGAFLRSNNAVLEWSFFFWHPWILMLLVPAVGLRFWSEELRSGTLELLGTMPVSTWSAIIGKYLAAALIWLIAIALTFPIWITANYLGSPDNVMIFSGYLGSFMLALVFLAITMLVSAFTRDQVVCLIISVAICVLLVLGSYDALIREIAKGLGESAAEGLAAVGVWDHFRSLVRGSLRLQDIVWAGSIIAVCLYGTNVILGARRS